MTWRCDQPGRVGLGLLNQGGELGGLRLLTSRLEHCYDEPFSRTAGAKVPQFLRLLSSSDLSHWTLSGQWHSPYDMHSKLST